MKTLDAHEAMLRQALTNSALNPGESQKAIFDYSFVRCLEQVNQGVPCPSAVHWFLSASSWQRPHVAMLFERYVTAGIIKLNEPMAEGARWQGWLPLQLAVMHSHLKGITEMFRLGADERLVLDPRNLPGVDVDTYIADTCKNKTLVGAVSALFRARSMERYLAEKSAAGDGDGADLADAQNGTSSTCSAAPADASVRRGRRTGL